jgi:hypothetical protein
MSNVYLVSSYICKQPRWLLTLEACKHENLVIINTHANYYYYYYYTYHNLLMIIYNNIQYGFNIHLVHIFVVGAMMPSYRIVLVSFLPAVGSG